MAKVIRQSIDINGNIIGDLDKATSLNSLVYDVKFPDSAIKKYAANVIAENILSQVNSNGYHTQELEQIVQTPWKSSRIKSSQRAFYSRMKAPPQYLGGAAENPTPNGVTSTILHRWLASAQAQRPRKVLMTESQSFIFLTSHVDFSSCALMYPPMYLLPVTILSTWILKKVWSW